MTSKEIANKTRLADIITTAEGIAKLARRMKKSNAYLNSQYLQALIDDAQSIIELAATIATVTGYAIDK
uniref:Uncharacterized protein n=1 Tax=viral metagenome TaxID=1070528 RepID=A0A6M3JKF7_9ZZZZ